MSAKTPKIVPVIISSREGLQAVVADIVRLKLARAAKQAEMELEMANVQKKHQDAILALDRQIQTNEAGAYVYCARSRKELFTDKKSIDMLLATVGFEFDPHSVEKLRSGDTWEEIADRVASVEWGSPYVDAPQPANKLDKKKLLRDREKFTADQLKEVGIRFEQEEQFYIKPKSEIAEGSAQAA